MTLVTDSYTVTAMGPDDARSLAAMMMGEDASYLAYFKPFSAPMELVDACAGAEKDIYAVLRAADGARVGFYMLRGWDDGYDRPSFGIYVASAYRGRGIAKLALSHAETQCRAAGAASVMLKVDAQNKAARTIYEAAGFYDVETCVDTGHTRMEKILHG